mmetsp:Transcript_100267/g.279294  ORF Transcript_100267/g.279294 Transcript_100267/m.279294 type:complete len:267 (+) Transcript_100267:1140-1940(+)
MQSSFGLREMPLQQVYACHHFAHVQLQVIQLDLLLELALDLPDILHDSRHCRVNHLRTQGQHDDRVRIHYGLHLAQVAIQQLHGRLCCGGTGIDLGQRKPNAADDGLHVHPILHQLVSQALVQFLAGLVLGQDLRLPGERVQGVPELRTGLVAEPLDGLAHLAVRDLVQHVQAALRIRARDPLQGPDEPCLHDPRREEGTSTDYLNGPRERVNASLSETHDAVKGIVKGLGHHPLNLVAQALGKDEASREEGQEGTSEAGSIVGEV